MASTSFRTMAVGTAVNPDSRFRPLVTPTVRSVWTVATVQPHVRSIRRAIGPDSNRNSAVSLNGSIRQPCDLIEGADGFTCQTLFHDLAVFRIQFDEHRISAVT